MRTRRGIAIGLTLIVMFILSTIAGVIALLGLEHMNQVQRNEEASTVLHIADGGLHQAMMELYKNYDWQTDGQGAYTTRLENAAYWWTFNSASGEPWCVNNLEGNGSVAGPGGVQVPAGTALLIVSASKHGVDGADPIRLAALVSPLYPALAVEGTIDVGGDFGSLKKEAAIFSNKVGGNPNINVDLTVTGQLFSRDSAGTIDYTSTGSRAKEYYGQPRFPIPDIPIATIVQSWGGTGTMGGPAEFTLILNSSNQGSYDLEIQGNQLRINGQNFRLPSNGNSSEVTLVLDARKGGNGAPGSGTVRVKDDIPRGVHLFVLGDLSQVGGISFGQTSTANPVTLAPAPRSIDPASNYLFVSGDVDFAGAGDMTNTKIFAGGDVLLNGNSTFDGFVYVQNGPNGVRFNGGSNDRPFNGLCIVRNGNFDMGQGNKDFYYDPAQMPRLNYFNIRGPIATLSWWVWER